MRFPLFTSAPGHTDPHLLTLLNKNRTTFGLPPLELPKFSADHSDPDVSSSKLSDLRFRLNSRFRSRLPPGKSRPTPPAPFTRAHPHSLPAKPKGGKTKFTAEMEIAREDRLMEAQVQVLGIYKEMVEIHKMQGECHERQEEREEELFEMEDELEEEYRDLEVAQADREIKGEELVIEEDEIDMEHQRETGNIVVI